MPLSRCFANIILINVYYIVLIVEVVCALADWLVYIKIDKYGNDTQPKDNLLI